MLIGILSDSHGDAAATARAVALLEKRGAEMFFHCGDVCGLAVLDELAGHSAHFVWGNCDDVSPADRRYVERIGLAWPGRVPVRVTLADRRIALYHGHEQEFAAALDDPDADYVFHGHTHVRADRREGRIRVVNPGALYRAKPRSAAMLDLDRDILTFLALDGTVLP